MEAIYSVGQKGSLFSKFSVFVVASIIFVSLGGAYQLSGHSWSTDGVFYSFCTSMPSSWEAEIKEAATSWNSVSNADFSFSEATNFCSQNYMTQGNLDSDIAARTHLEYDSSGTITMAGTTFNMNHPWSTTGESGELDVQNVAAHEWGHWLQLLHSSDSGATMYSSTTYGETKKRTLEEDDKDGIRAIY